MPPTSILYIKNAQVDKSKWDRCIDEAPNGLIYSYSFYLDHMSRHWDALVMNDYEAVMPLTWNKKYGISYLYQPPFTASLGIFGKELTEERVGQFIQCIPSRFRLIEIELNQGNILAAPHGFSAIRNNYVLYLNRSYEQLYAAFNENIRRNIKKAQQLNCRYAKNVPIDAIIALSKDQMKKISNLTDNDYDQFKKLYQLLSSNGRAEACGVYSTADELIASCVYFFSHKRAYYI